MYLQMAGGPERSFRPTKASLVSERVDRLVGVLADLLVRPDEPKLHHPRRRGASG